MVRKLGKSITHEKFDDGHLQEGSSLFSMQVDETHYSGCLSHACFS